MVKCNETHTFSRTRELRSNKYFFYYERSYRPEAEFLDVIGTKT
jgi:hypothetical protein